ncbi:hypothetical protein APR11_001845 [Nocardia amikacinitolerans]|nr:hypothetical protein [Nocardia amikacinitolerans]
MRAGRLTGRDAVALVGKAVLDLLHAGARRFVLGAEGGGEEGGDRRGQCAEDKRIMVQQGHFGASTVEQRTGGRGGIVRWPSTASVTRSAQRVAR